MHDKAAKIADQLLKGHKIQGHTAQSLISAHCRTIRRSTYIDDFNAARKSMTAKKFIAMAMSHGQAMVDTFLKEANTHPHLTLSRLVPLYYE